MSEPKTFELTEQHLALLRHANVRWEDCEFGAPAIDCKRPYGNSSVISDIAEILGVPIDSEDDEYGLDHDTQARLHRLHMETETALQIVLHTGEFRVGQYKTSSPYTADWSRA